MSSLFGTVILQWLVNLPWDCYTVKDEFEKKNLPSRNNYSMSIVKLTEPFNTARPWSVWLRSRWNYLCYVATWKSLLVKDIFGKRTMYIWVAPSYKWPAMGVFESTSGGKTDEWISGTQVDDILGERTIYAQSYCVQGEASPLRPRLGMVPLPSQFCKISVWPSKIGHTVEKPKSKSIQPRSQKVGSTYGEKCDNNLNPSCETTVHCQALLLILEHKKGKWKTCFTKGTRNYFR